MEVQSKRSSHCVLLLVVCLQLRHLEPISGSEIGSVTIVMPSGTESMISKLNWIFFSRTCFWPFIGEEIIEINNQMEYNCLTVHQLREQDNLRGKMQSIQGKLNQF